MGERQKLRSLVGRDIAAGWPGACRDPARRERAEQDLEFGLRSYFPHVFPLPFCRDHRRYITRIEEAMRDGGLHAFSMQRGGGKTQISSRSGILGLCSGKRRFGLLLGATLPLTLRITRHVKQELTGNELLAEDYPEVCYPFIRLENKASRAAGQVWEGQPTGIQWASDGVVFATIPPSQVGGSALYTRSITGAIKGLSHLLSSGEVIRPDFVLLDDVQTRTSAKSLLATENRIATIEGDVLGLAGHNKSIAAVMAVTPIFENDLAEVYLDRTKKPEWRGERSKMVYSFPKREDLWDRYRTIADEARQTDGDQQAATAFYAEHRAEMDAGAELAWPEMFPEGKLSALQHAMDLKFRDPVSFAAEYQGEPLKTAIAPGLMLTRDEIARKTNGLDMGIVPAWASLLTAFVDVHDALLYYAVAAFSRDYTAALIEYGTFPPQNRRWFTLSDAAPTMAEYLGKTRPDLKGAAPKSLIAAALDIMLPWLRDRTWLKADTTPLALSHIMVDTGYEGDVVKAAIRRLKLPPVILPLVMPSRGVGLGATKKPFALYTKKPGDVVGWHWRAPKPNPGELRTVEIDTNHFKRFLHQQLAMAVERPGSFSFWGDKHTDHGLLADQLTAEKPKLVESKTDQRTVVQFEAKPGSESHLLDCPVGCFVGASMRECSLPGAEEAEHRTKPRQQYNMGALRR
jgi:hypothetical protein